MNREQFISHVRGSQKALRRFLAALCCGDLHMADDIAQETLIKAWLSCEDFRDEGAFEAWIRRIAYNTFLNYRRRGTLDIRLDEATEIPAMDSADAAFRYQALYVALARLTAKERTSILLHYLEGYSIKEISEIEDVSHDAVKQHLSRGRLHLRSLLETNA